MGQNWKQKQKALTMRELMELEALLDMGAQPDSIRIVRNRRAASPIIPLVKALRHLLNGHKLS